MIIIIFLKFLSKHDKVLSRGDVRGIAREKLRDNPLSWWNIFLNFQRILEKNPKKILDLMASKS